MTPNHNQRPAWRKLFQGIQGKLILILCILLIPTLLIQAYLYDSRFRIRRAEELQTNLEMARAAGKAFDAFVMDAVHTELAVGSAITASKTIIGDDQKPVLESFRADNLAIYSAFWIAPNGIIVASCLQQALGISVADRSYFKRITSGKPWAVSELLHGKITGRLCFVISRGIRNVQGQLMGIVAAVIEPDLLDAVLGIERRKGAAVSFIDGNGMLVYRYPRTYPSWEERNWLEKQPQIRKTLNGVEYAWVGKSFYEDQIHITGLVPIREIGWLAGADRREEDALAAIRASLLPQTIMFFLVTLTAFGAALAFSRKVSVSIGKLRDHAFALGKGESRDPVTLSGTAELDDLANAFDQMAKDIRNREQDLNRAAAELRQSDARFRSFFELSLDGIFSVNSEGRFLTANPAAQRISGYTEDELCTLNILDICAQEYRETTLAAFARGLATGRPNEMETALIRKDGRIVDVVVAGSPTMVSGKVEGIFCVVRDVTERKHAESAIQKTLNDLVNERQRLEAIMEALPVGVAIWDASGRMLDINGAFQSIWGGPVPPIHSASDYSFFQAWWADTGKPVQPEEWASARAVLQGETILGQVIKISRFDGNSAYIMNSASPIRDAHGNIVGSAATIMDITERKWMEEELRSSRDALDLRVRERTAQLEKANEELRQTPSKLIEAQEEERKRLASELHDSIGQTLAALKFRIEYVLNILRKDKKEEALRVTGEFVPILQRSIEETRAIYMGLRPRLLEDFGVVAALRWYRDELIKLYPERHIEIDVSVHENEVPKYLDIPIFRIAQEALNNIAKHSKAEWVDILLSKKAEGIELVVSDDGVGMDVAQILQSSTARSLGLAGMRERVEMFGGSFEITASPGEGTTVRACWPLVSEFPASSCTRPD